jgi:stromal membrane-associated protein
LFCFYAGKEKEVLAMENGGNAKVNAIFEARKPSVSSKPSSCTSASERERFIFKKYERRKYYDPSVLTSQSFTNQRHFVGNLFENRM